MKGKSLNLESEEDLHGRFLASKITESLSEGEAEFEVSSEGPS